MINYTQEDNKTHIDGEGNASLISLMHETLCLGQKFGMRQHETGKILKVPVADCGSSPKTGKVSK